MSLVTIKQVVPETLKTLRDGWQTRVDEDASLTPEEVKVVQNAIKRISELIAELGG